VLTARKNIMNFIKNASKVPVNKLHHEQIYNMAEHLIIEFKKFQKERKNMISENLKNVKELNEKEVDKELNKEIQELKQRHTSAFVKQKMSILEMLEDIVYKISLFIKEKGFFA